MVAVLRRQFPRAMRKGLHFAVRLWEGVLWVEVFVLEKPEEPEYILTRQRKRILAAADLKDEPYEYKGMTIRRAKISPDLIAAVALML